MSTRSEQFVKRLTSSINRAFPLTWNGVRHGGIKAEVVEARGVGISFSGSGMRIIHEGRVLTVDESGGIVGLTQDGVEMDLRALPREPVPRPAKRPEPAKPVGYRRLITLEE